MLKNKQSIHHERHPFHLVDPSPWPLITGIAILSFALGFIMHFCNDNTNMWTLSWFLLGILFLIFSLSRWFTDIVIEATFEGHHTSKVQENVLLGMKLFIASEVMFFFSFFWAYFHLSLIPSIFTGGIWPSFSIEKLDPVAIPFANTVILFSSGLCVTLAHKALLLGKRKEAVNGLLSTIFLGVLFTALQGYEYLVLPFSISTNSYGSVFYMITGFHGLHVIIGTIFLIVCFTRLIRGHFCTRYHVGFICAIWYWHFVDIVWIGLYIIVYFWGASDAPKFL